MHFLLEERKRRAQSGADIDVPVSVIYGYCSSSVIRKRRCESHCTGLHCMVIHCGVCECVSESEVFSGRTLRLDNNSDLTSVFFEGSTHVSLQLMTILMFFLLFIAI